MSDVPGLPVPAADDGNRFQVAAVVIVVTGVVLLAAAAFLVSYAGIRQVAVAAGVSPALAGLYPLIVDAVLVVACVAALALRGARWPMLGYAWLSVIVLLAVVAVARGGARGGHRAAAPARRGRGGGTALGAVPARVRAVPVHAAAPAHGPCHEPARRSGRCVVVAVERGPGHRRCHAPPRPAEARQLRHGSTDRGCLGLARRAPAWMTGTAGFVAGLGRTPTPRRTAIPTQA